MRVGHTRTHTYSVPPLDYEDEDIKIQATLVQKRGGGSMQLLGRVCQETDVEVCKDSARQEFEANDLSLLFVGQDNGSGIFLEIDHDEDSCLLKHKGDCHYVFVVHANSDNGDFCLYEMLVSHSQNNHQLLKENVPLIDEVDQLQFKYYKF